MASTILFGSISSALRLSKDPLSLGDVVTVSLLAGALILRLFLLVGPTGSDDVNYFHFSEQLLRGEQFTMLHHHGGRLAFLLLVGVPAAVLGSIQAGAILNVLLLSLRDILVVSYLRSRVNSNAIACAAGVLSLNALSTAYAGTFLPDGLLSLSAFLATILVYESWQKKAAERLIYIAAAGFFTSISYSSKDAGILLVPCAAIWLVAPGRFLRGEALRDGLKGVTLYLAVFGLFFLIEMGIYFMLSGDPFYRMHAISRVHNATITESKTVIDFIHRVYWNLRTVTQIETGSLSVLIVAAIIWTAAIVQRNRFAFFAWTGAFITIYLIFGTSSFSRLMPLPVQDRYFEVIIPLLAIAAAGLISEHGGVAQRKMSRVAIAIPLLLALGSIPAVAYNAGDVTFSYLGRNTAVGIEAISRAMPERLVYVSPQMHFMVEPFISSERYRQLKVIPAAGPLEPGFYIMHPWKDGVASYRRAAEVEAMPLYIVVDKEPNHIAKLVSKTREGNAIAVKVNF